MFAYEESGPQIIRNMRSIGVDLEQWTKQGLLQIHATRPSLQGGAREDSEVGVSSLMDAWLFLRNIEYNGERNRTLYVMKARGIAHSNQVREFVLSGEGVDLVDVPVSKCSPGCERNPISSGFRSSS
jgi:circadian clock protein KaiC